MARRANDGWEYFPVACNFATGDKEIYLRDKWGHMSLLVWLLLQADLYGVGVCYKWDEAARYAFKSRHGLTELQVNKAIMGLIAAGLVDKDVYEDSGLLTSKTIQEQGLAMARASRRRVIKCPENVWLLGNCVEDDDRLRIELTPIKKRESKGKESKGNPDNADQIRTNPTKPPKIPESVTKNRKKFHDWVYLDENQIKSVENFYQERGCTADDVWEAVRVLDKWFDDNPTMRSKRTDDAKALKGWPLDEAIKRRKNLLQLEQTERRNK